MELGAGWVPELLRRLDWVVKHWSRNDANLQAWSRTPSQQISEQLAFTPFVFEAVGDLIDQSMRETCVRRHFSARFARYPDSAGRQSSRPGCTGLP